MVVNFDFSWSVKMRAVGERVGRHECAHRLTFQVIKREMNAAVDTAQAVVRFQLGQGRQRARRFAAVVVCSVNVFTSPKKAVRISAPAVTVPLWPLG